MPWKMITHKDGTVTVKNTMTGAVHAKHTTKEKAAAQMRLLQGVEHGWTPTGAKARKKRAKK